MTARYPFAVIKEKLHARRGEIADFAIGRRKLPLDDDFVQWIHLNPGLALQPASPDDVAAFREEAVGFLKTEYDSEVSHEQIVPVPSGRAGMSAFVACAIEPGAAVVVTEPGYPAFARMASHRHADVIPINLDPGHDFAPDTGPLEALEDISVVALNYPNNPTAAVLTDETRSSVADFAGRHHSIVFNDAVYGPLTYEGHAACLLTGATAAGNGRFVELHSLTKLYPLGPQSGSFLVGTPDPVRSIATYSEFAWAPMSALQIRATTRSLSDVVGRRSIRDFYASQIARLRRTLLELGFHPYPTPSGIYALCRVPPTIGGQRVGSAEEAASILMDEYDIAVMPWDVPEHSYLRFCSMYRDEDLEKLAALKGRLLLPAGD